MKIAASGPLHGRLKMPGDKSISHRAVLFGAMAKGQTEVRGLLRGEDVLATLRAVQALGATVEEGEVLRLRGGGWRDAGLLDCGNSGTTARLMLGALAGRASATLDGDASLRRRPMLRVSAPLRMMGADLDPSPNLPISVRRSELRGILWDAQVASAQVKSAVLLAGLSASGTTSYCEPIATRDHTERMLGAMGAFVGRQGEWIRILPGGLEGIPVIVPGDISSAAFWLVAASIVPGSDLLLENVGLNPTRTGVLKALSRMRADISILDFQDDAEPRGTLRVRASSLRGTTIGGTEIPTLIDEIPVLAVAAAFAEGETLIQNAQELRVKESDRIATTVAGLRALGVEADARPDGMRIVGNPGLVGRNAVIDSEGDHRIAMAFSVAGLKVGTEVLSVENVATSYPGFWADLAAVG